MFETESFVDEITSERKVVFYRNKSDTFIRLSTNERLFILAGTSIRHSDENGNYFDSIQLVVFDSSSVAYTWTEDKELYYVNVKQFKLNVPVRKSVSVEPFCPVYSSDAACHK